MTVQVRAGSILKDVSTNCPHALSPTVLIVDDDEDVRYSLRRILEHQGYRVETAKNASAGLERFAADPQSYDVVFLDFQMPDRSGLDVLPELLAIDPAIAVIMITGFGDSRLAVQTLRIGAVDFIEKPFDIEHVRRSAKHAAHVTAIARQRYREDATAKNPYAGLITDDLGMKRVLNLIERVAPHNSTVLITGESGTGKELIARAVHAASPRRDKPFVAVNCAAIPGELLEAELFGRERGAYTGADKPYAGRIAAADGGTLFLDEIGDLPLNLQAKLLRTLETRSVTPLGSDRERRVDLRVVAATHRDIAAYVADGRFREDLYYRLAQFPIHIPPLRERRGDIARLVEFFLGELRNEGIAVGGVSPGALDVLVAYDWPGNVRQLKNVLYRAAVLAAGATINREHLALEILQSVPVERLTAVANEALGETTAATAALIPLWKTADEVWPWSRIEAAVIRAALDACAGNVSEAAKRLGLGRTTLYRKLEALEGFAGND